MRGDLSDTPAADVCRALGATSATGTLEIEGPDGRGVVVVRDGDVVAATSPTPRARIGDRLVNAGLLGEDRLAEVLRSQARADAHQRTGVLLVERGLVPLAAVRRVVEEQVIDAVFDLVRWRYGAYRFDLGEPSEHTEVLEVPVRMPVGQLLVEVARRQREWSELVRVIPDLDAIPTFRSEERRAAADLDADEFTVLASIDGVRSVRELAGDLGYGPFEAARIVYGLTLLDIVEIVLPEDEIGRALEDALHDLAASPESPPEGASLVSPPEGASLESPPGVADVARLLAELSADDRGPATSPTHPPPPAVEAEAVTPPEDPSAPAAARAAGEPTPRADGDDVAELLRELSRLAADGPAETPHPTGMHHEPGTADPGPHQPPAHQPPAHPSPAHPPPAARRSPSGRDDTTKRRRRFGRG